MVGFSLSQYNKIGPVQTSVRFGLLAEAVIQTPQSILLTPYSKRARVTRNSARFDHLHQGLAASLCCGDRELPVRQ
jgi:hypothetical protein